MPVVNLSNGGINIACLVFNQEWSTALTITHRFATDITAGRSGREGRRPEDEANRYSAAVHCLIFDDTEAQSFRNALAILATGQSSTSYVGVPIWVDKLTGAEWGTRIYDPQFLFDLDDQVLVAAGATLDPDTTYAPLLVGHIDSLPETTAVTDSIGDFTFTLTEDSPWDYRIGINATGTAGLWPDTLIPNWTNPVKDTPTQGLEFDQIGETRERIIGAAEIPYRNGEEAQFDLMCRDDIRTLLAFFVASQGSRQPFTAPLWYSPGDPTSLVPATTTVRFGSDSLQADYGTDSFAAIKVKLSELPWEVEGVSGEVPLQPARIFLYQYRYLLPAVQYFRYTNWVRALTVALSGPYDGTYNPAPMKHQEIAESIDTKSDTISIDSFMFSGNPLMMWDPNVLEGQVMLDILEIESDPIDPSTATLRWTGQVMKAPYKGRKITAAASFAAGLFDRAFPNVLIGYLCNTKLFSTRCTLNKADFQQTGTFTAADGCVLTITSTSTDADNTYVYGWIEVGSGATWEKRAIVGSSVIAGGQQLVVDWPVRQAPAGQAVVFYRGCDLSFGTCQALGNSINFRGHPNLPLIDLTLPYVTPPAASGKK